MLVNPRALAKLRYRIYRGGKGEGRGGEKTVRRLNFLVTNRGTIFHIIVLISVKIKYFLIFCSFYINFSTFSFFPGASLT